MDLPFHENASWRIFENARSLKKVMTPSENLLWQNLRNRKVNSYKFRRQHPISKYIVDFYCHEAKLVIEVDGGIHFIDDNVEYDKLRTLQLEAFGLKVIRFRNEEVLKNMSEVLAEIRKHLTPGPSPLGEGESESLKS
ncbi:MAG: endonuclease domain-containing protein [Cytophagales bacterium]|nr:endonuclease domain-containing protein [Cytophagales bacterium]